MAEHLRCWLRQWLPPRVRREEALRLAREECSRLIDGDPLQADSLWRAGQWRIYCRRHGWPVSVCVVVDGWTGRVLASRTVPPRSPVDPPRTTCPMLLDEAVATAQVEFGRLCGATEGLLRIERAGRRWQIRLRFPQTYGSCIVTVVDGRDGEILLTASAPR